MRRDDRAVTDFAQMVKILLQCDTVSLALIDGDFPYVLPFNFGCECVDDRLVLYFHGAKEGHKYDVMAQNPHAAFCASCEHSFVPGKVDCASAFLYASVCGRGTVCPVEGEEALHALSCIMDHYVPGTEHVFLPKHAAAVRVWRMDVTELTGKRRTRK